MGWTENVKRMGKVNLFLCVTKYFAIKLNPFRN
jgi:hypothetical protein